ncbi:MAG: helix-turn-helix transcriptional regulator [Phycisphaerae bacterium]|nr:helix-turn-helix transcriptional regulator [Phycisphaerae bacterium]
MKFETQLLKGIAPAVVLQILSSGQMYGYQLGEQIEKRSGDILSLGKGTLYPLLYNLEAKKLVKGRWEKSESGRKRKYYSITSKGHAQLTEQKQQLQQLNSGLNLIFGGALSNPALA